MKFIADLLLDFIISPYTTDNSRKDTEKEKIEPIAISLDLAENEIISAESGENDNTHCRCV